MCFGFIKEQIMTIAATNPLAFAETQRRTSRRLCRRWLWVALIILVAIQAVLTTGVWRYPHAKLLIPDAIRTEHGFGFPPLVTVRDNYIVRYEPPTHPLDDEGNQNTGEGDK
jgi:hypothetical protein